MIWVVRYVNLWLLVALAVTVFAAVVYSTSADGCIIQQVYGIGEGKVTQPLPCEWAHWVHE